MRSWFKSVFTASPTNEKARSMASLVSYNTVGQPMWSPTN